MGTKTKVGLQFADVSSTNNDCTCIGKEKLIQWSKERELNFLWTERLYWREEKDLTESNDGGRIEGARPQAETERDRFF